ncbi:MAG: efflux RND transporter permease subunit, partial [Blastocatellia bacterium]
IVVALTAFFAFGLRRGLELDVSPLGFVEKGSQARTDFENARKKFGADDYLVVAVACDDVFAPANLARLRNLHERIEKTKGVAEVLSLANAPCARSVDGVITAVKLMPDARAGDLENGGVAEEITLEEARRVATSDRLYVGNLVSADSRTAAFNILLKSDLPTTTRHVITKQIYDLTNDAGFNGAWFAGDPFSQWRATKAIKHDLILFLPLTLLLIALVLWLSFRSLVAVVLPLLTVGIGLVWLFGLMAYFNAHFTILALMLPTLMLAIGCSYMVHVLNQIGIVCEKRLGIGKAELLEEAMRFINLPVIVSALTIIAGFLSLVFTHIPAIRTTGVYAATGAALTMILSLTFIPAALMLLGERAITFRLGLTGRMVRLLEATGRWATSQQTLLYALTAIIVVVSVIGVRRIVIDIDYFHFFKPNSETTVGLAEISRRLSGAVSFEIIVEGKQAGAIERPETLERIAELQNFAEKQKDASGQGIDRALSVVDFVRHLNRAFHDNDQRHYSIPSDEDVIRELFSDRDHLRSFLTPDGRTARILIRSNLSGSQAMAGAIREVEKKGRELLPDFRVLVTGTFVLLNRTSDQIAGEQKQSITIALVTIFLMLSMLFRSLRVGLTALVPNLIPVLFFFGFMGWRGIELNLTTSLVASLVLGLAVDNAVQFVVRFRRVQSETASLNDAIIQSMRLSGRPIIYANIALAATFAIFAFSNFAPIASFGLLSAVTIIGCLIEDLVLLPARLTSPVFRAK